MVMVLPRFIDANQIGTAFLAVELASFDKHRIRENGGDDFRQRSGRLNNFHQYLVRGKNLLFCHSYSCLDSTDNPNDTA